MRLRLAMLLALSLVAGVGCFTAGPERTTTQYGARPPFQGPTGDDVVQLLVALIERPVGDFALNQEIWELADEQSVDLQAKVLLEENGFRMGQFGTQPPGSLRDLVASERSCVNPRRIQMRSGNNTQILLGPSSSRYVFQLRRDGQATPVELDQGQGMLLVTPHFTAEGKVQVQFTPAVKHGQQLLEPRSIQDPGGTLRWDLQVHQPMETYTHLSWQQTVCDSEYIIVGTWLEKHQTLGQSCFIEAEGIAPVQRLLVLRAMHSGQDEVPANDRLSRSPSLAVQAGLTAVRGSSR
jgi:hypothetical protein